MKQFVISLDFINQNPLKANNLKTLKRKLILTIWT